MKDTVRNKKMSLFISSLHSGNVRSSLLFSWQNTLNQIDEAFLERLIGIDEAWLSSIKTQPNIKVKIFHPPSDGLLSSAHNRRGRAFDWRRSIAKVRKVLVG